MGLKLASLCPNGVELKTIEECCNILDNKRKPIKKSRRESGFYPYYGANGIQDYVSNYIFDGDYVLVGEDGSVITKDGTPVVTMATGKIWVNNHAHIIQTKNGILLKYLYYYIQTINVSGLVHGNIPKLTSSDLKSIEIPLPPLPIQEEIVRILDAFPSMTNELKEEIALQKAQINYYRNKLLAFN